jgi:hypothetical protein
MTLSFYALSLIVALVISVTSMYRHGNEEKIVRVILTVTLVLILTVEMVAFWMKGNGLNNFILYNFGWIYLEFILLAAYFYQFESTSLGRKNIVWVTALLTCGGVYNSIFLQNPFTEFQTYSFLPISLCMIGLSARFIYRLLKLRLFANRSLGSIPHFWINTFILFFYLEATFCCGLTFFKAEFFIDEAIIFNVYKGMLGGMRYLVFGIAFYIPELFRSVVSQNQ